MTEIEERRKFMLRMVDKFDLYFQNRGLEKRIADARNEPELMKIAGEMDDIINADPGYQADTRELCRQIDNPAVNPNQRIKYPPRYFTRGRSPRSLYKYGIMHNKQPG